MPECKKKIAQVSSYADDDGNNNGVSVPVCLYCAVCPREIIIMSVFVNIMHISTGALHALGRT